MTLINAKIMTMSENDIENGFVSFENGKITAVGTMDEFTGEGGDIFDAAGCVVTPGLIDAHTHLGMFEDGVSFEGDDGNEDTDPSTPQMRAIDAINPMDICFSEVLRSGITSVVTGPGSANPVGGQMAAIKTYGKRVDNMIIAAPAAIKMALGENPKCVYHGKNQMPSTRMATAAIIRETLMKAQKYLEAVERAENDPDIDPPEFDIKCESLIPLLRGEIPAHIHAHRADDIFTAIRLSKEFDFKLVLIHCTEGHLIADEIAREGVPAVVGPFVTDRPKPELVQLTPSTVASLAKAGVNVSICTDHPVTPLKYLTFCASVAVREGLPAETAMKALTINAAQIIGIDGRVGSIETGKDADVVVWDGDPLDMKTRVHAVFVDGRRVV